MPSPRLQETEADGCNARPTLPPLSKKFPVEQYPLREITGTGFTAQSVRGPEADACSATASEMLVEWRGNLLSSVSSEGDVSVYSEAESFTVPDLPPHQGAAQVTAVYRRDWLYGFMPRYLPSASVNQIRLLYTSVLQCRLFVPHKYSSV